ncbi:MAG TPA: O-antigen polymerase [Fibrobacteria bacterium]|nr:O-antigen polymerase [Fibrobacteria bacterium]
MAFLFMAGAFAAIAAGRYFSGRWLTPFNAYLFAQGFLLGIAFLKLSPEMSDFHISTWLAVISSMLAFGIGSLLGRFEKPGHLEPNSTFEKEFETTFLHLASRIQPLLLISFSIGVYLSYQSAGQWPAFSSSPEDSRILFAWPGFAGVMFFQVIYILALCSVVLLTKENGFLWRILGVTGIAFPVLVSGLSGMRFYGILVIISILFFRDSKRPLKLSHLIISGVAIVSLLVFLFLVRLNLLNATAINFGLQHRESLKALYMPIYLYVANNYWNLDWLFLHHDTFRSLESSFGYFSFSGLIYPTHFTFALDDALETSMRFVSVLKIPNFNTTSYQGVLFVDFGWPGLLIIPLVWGYFSTVVHRRATKSECIYYRILYAILGFSIFFSFFVWIFQQPSFVIGLLFVLAMGAFAKINSTRRLNASKAKG